MPPIFGCAYQPMKRDVRMESSFDSKSTSPDIQRRERLQRLDQRVSRTVTGIHDEPVGRGQQIFKGKLGLDSMRVEGSYGMHFAGLKQVRKNLCLSSLL